MSRGARLGSGTCRKGLAGGTDQPQPTQAAAGRQERRPPRFGESAPRRNHYAETPLASESSDSLAPRWRLGVANYGLQVQSDQESFL